MNLATKLPPASVPQERPQHPSWPAEPSLYLRASGLPQVPTSPPSEIPPTPHRNFSLSPEYFPDRCASAGPKAPARRLSHIPLPPPLCRPSTPIHGPGTGGTFQSRGTFSPVRATLSPLLPAIPTSKLLPNSAAPSDCLDPVAW